MHDPKLARHAAHNAFLAAMAQASGEEELAQGYRNSMMRACALAKPLDTEVVYDAS